MRHENPHTTHKIKRSAKRILRSPTSSTGAKSVAVSALVSAPNKPSKKARDIVAMEAKRIILKNMESV